MSDLDGIFIAMEMFETALGRLVPAKEREIALEDAILRLLFNYRMNPQNPSNAPMRLSRIAYAVSADRKLVEEALKELMQGKPPKIEEGTPAGTERTFAITDFGLRYVGNLLEELLSAS